MNIKQTLFKSFLCCVAALSFSANASLYICQKGRCDYAMDGMSLKPWIKQLHTFFKTPNARIDFCQADAQKHVCAKEGLNWEAQSPVARVYFSIPVARTIPNKNTLLMDYLVSANAFLPSCSFSNSTFEPAENGTIRLVSHSFECQLTGIGRTQLQNTFFIDYIDFDNSVIGGSYTIQTHGEISGNSTGYTLMKFRHGNTLLPLVPQPYYGDMPPAPDARQAKRMAKALNPPPQPQSSMDKFMAGVKDWWQELKESFNLDNSQRRPPNEEPSWWDNFSEKFMKVIYLEPLE